MWQDIADRCPFAWSASLLPALWRRVRATDETLEEDEGPLQAIEQIQENRIERLLERAAEAIGNSLKGEQPQQEDIAQETA